MATTTLTDALFRHAIGFDPLARLAEINTSFPPHNIEKLDEERYLLTLAVAGFSRDDISITTQKGVLRIEGNGFTDSRRRATSAPQFLYQGIALRDFVREFKLGADVEVESATLEHGLLEITLARILPEIEKPRVISII